MAQMWGQVSQLEVEEINHLYESLRRDPNHLKKIDQTPFIDTPFHRAASSGRTHLALEIMNLNPSFGRKLNPDGFSPLHLALSNGHINTVRRLVKHHPELIRVQGRERKTALHCVAERDDDNDLYSSTNGLLAEFLLACPLSIQDLTVRGETAVHLAVKHQRIGALKVFLGWVHRSNNGKVLSRRDEDGNNLLHVAVSTNQPEAVKMLIDKVNRNEKNSMGLKKTKRLEPS